MSAMTDQTVRTPALTGVVPYINVEGASEASAFYQKAFGAKEISRMAAPDGKRLMHCRLEVNGGPLMMTDCFPEHGYEFQPSHSFTLQLVVEDGDAWWNRAVEAGCQVISPFQKMFWGDRWGQVMDPFQIRWSIDEPAKD
jgi:PhnB protein